MEPQLIEFVYSGYLSPRSGRENTNGNWSTNGMVLYDHSTDKALNISQPGQLGYTHGALHNIGPFGDRKGLLLVLMAKEYPLNLNFVENDPLDGKSVSKFKFHTATFYLRRELGAHSPSLGRCVI